MLVALITPDRIYHPFVAMIVEGLRARGDSIIASDPGNGLLPDEVLDYEPGWQQAAADADAVLVFFGKVGSLAAGAPPTRAPKYHLLAELELEQERMAYLDYSEMTATGHPMPGQVEAMRTDPARRLGHPWLNVPLYDATGQYFKRECLPEDEFQGGVHPIAFGLLSEYVVPVPRQGKDWDLFCCFGHTLTGLRKEIVAECERLRAVHRHKKIIVQSRISGRQFRDSCARSKIVVDAWGHGDHCYRLWEGVGAQACVLYQRYQVLTGPEWFREGENGEAEGYSTVKEFRERAEALLSLPNETMAIGRRGFKRALAHHTGKARVDYIFKMMGL